MKTPLYIGLIWLFSGIGGRFSGINCNFSGITAAFSGIIVSFSGIQTNELYFTNAPHSRFPINGKRHSIFI